MDKAVLDKAFELKESGVSWTKLPEELYKATGKLYPSIRTVMRRDPKYKYVDTSNIKENMLKSIEKGATTDSLCQIYKVSPRVLEAVLDDLREEGYLIDDIAGSIKLCKTVKPQDNVHTENWRGEKIIKFGAISDTHQSNKWEQLTFLNYLYDRFAEEGIKTVYHAGDITDGYYKNRPGHIYELHKIGHDQQAQHTIDTYPSRPGIITKYITGNHDHTHILNGGVDIGKTIAKARPDMEYLGSANAKVNLTPNCVIEINHPLDGSAYALSYSIQKYIESMTGGEKPNILLNGHHHKAMYIFYRNVHGFECGCTEAQTPWMKGKRLAAHIGGWIIEIHVDEQGTITKCKGEFIPLYKPLEDDY